MSERWRVNDGTQVKWKDKLYVGGEEFSATEEQVQGSRAAGYVTKVRQQSAPKAENKAVAAPEPNVVKSPVQPDVKTSGPKSK